MAFIQVHSLNTVKFLDNMSDSQMNIITQNIFDSHNINSSIFTAVTVSIPAYFQ